MKRTSWIALGLVALLGVGACGPVFARDVTITRDDFGIAHVHGGTDADAVFGAIYAQAEDDFARVEHNYLTSLGRLSEAEGPGMLWQDLRQRLFVDPDELRDYYRASPAWLRKLMQAWADGLNSYLHDHPEVHPRVLHEFEPWMALSFTEGSIGGDIERVKLDALQAFYEQPQQRAHSLQGSGTVAGLPEYTEPRGSNGIVIAPGHTRDGHALLLINPHTSFFFRSELQMTSGQGLDAYGAVTWGQFFVYQGFNAQAGWMHTSSGVDNVDEFAETIVTAPDGRRSYRYGAELRPVTRKAISLRYVRPDGSIATRSFDVYFTHHGPIVRRMGDQWVAVALMNRPVLALEQSFLRTKAHDLDSFLRVAQLRANSTNNTLFADSKGEIAYLHPQFVPRRDDRFDYRKPVDGSDPATDWHGLHDLASLPQAIDPASGWAYNTNDAPWSAAGEASPQATNYPRYMDEVGDNPRGAHVVRLLTATRQFTLEGLITAAFDPYLTAFARLLPSLFEAYDAMPSTDSRKPVLAGAIALLRQWDDRWSRESAPTSLAVFWAEALWSNASRPAADADMTVWDYMATRMTAEERIAALTRAVDRLTHDFGSYSVPWGEINRLQRNDGSLTQTFSDTRPSLPVPFTSARWGSLASFGAQAYPGTRCYYGTSGNSFVAAVEFGPRVRARAVSVGGESGHPTSHHFFDQAQRYTEGDLRPVYFYRDELEGHVEKVSHPGSSRVPAGGLH